MIREKWKRKQREIRLRSDLTMKDKRTLGLLAKMQSLKEEGAVRDAATAVRPSIREEFPFHNWNGLLKIKAEAGMRLLLQSCNHSSGAWTIRRSRLPSRR